MTSLINNIAKPAAMRREDGKPARGAVFYRGPSMIDGSPIVAVAIFKSANTKTGNMVQTYILRDDMAPAAAIRAGLDASICGSCVHRGVIGSDGKPEQFTRTCYVVIGQGPTGVWKGLQAHQYPTIDASILAKRGGMFAGRFVRLGTYGDPAAVPFEIWESLLAGTTGHNGYTHQWQECDPRFASLCMASADDAVTRGHAKALGYRTFRVRPALDKLQGEFICPASEEAGRKLTCIDCKACGGTDSKARADVAITLHGGSAVMANAKRRDMVAS
jgi:hypothetical protein